MHIYKSTDTEMLTEQGGWGTKVNKKGVVKQFSNAAYDQPMRTNPKKYQMISRGKRCNTHEAHTCKIKVKVLQKKQRELCDFVARNQRMSYNY